MNYDFLVKGWMAPIKNYKSFQSVDEEDFEDLICDDRFKINFDRTLISYIISEEYEIDYGLNFSRESKGLKKEEYDTQLEVLNNLQIEIEEDKIVEFQEYRNEGFEADYFTITKEEFLKRNEFM